MTVAYVCGPMTGYKDFNYPAFHAAAKVLRKFGYKVLNPAENFEGRTDLDWETYLAEGLQQVEQAEVIFMLPGWQNSLGARREVDHARERGIQTLAINWDSALWADVPLRGEKDPSFVVTGHPDERVQAHVIDSEGDVWLEGDAPGPAVDGVEEPIALPDELEPRPRRRIHELEQQVARLRRQVAELEDDGPETILDEAKSLVHGARRATYDHPLDNHERIAKIWSGILGVDITAEQAAMCMVGVKLSREAFKPKRDNVVDLAGYALVLWEIREERARREGKPPPG